MQEQESTQNNPLQYAFNAACKVLGDVNQYWFQVSEELEEVIQEDGIAPLRVAYQTNDRNIMLLKAGWSDLMDWAYGERGLIQKEFYELLQKCVTQKDRDYFEEHGTWSREFQDQMRFRVIIVTLQDSELLA